jgi:hypothetical protein
MCRRIPDVEAVMQRPRTAVSVMVVSLSLAAGALQAQPGVPRISAQLTGLQEVPVVASAATGQFNALIDDATQAVDYELSYSGLEANVLMAHIHLAQPNVNGGIVVWLCTTPGVSAPAGTATCPQSGTVSGSIRPSDVLTVGTNGAQGILAGDFRRFLDALRGGYAYVNVHTQRSPGGEIRGQIGPGNRR